MAEQLESRVLGIEQGQEELSNQVKKILDLLLNKGKTVQDQDHEEENDPIHPPGFTPIQGQSSGPPPFTLEKPPHGTPPFIPAVTGIGMPSSAVAGVGTSKTATEYRCDELEERLRAIEGTRTTSTARPSDYCLVPNVVIPPKFKMPDFEKFDGTTCPQTHLRMYCQSMAAYTDNEKLMMHCFQSSLTGTAARWYVQQNKAQIRTWGDLADAFEAQYRHILEMAPDRMFLSEMEKKPTETFREYAHRWRDAATQVDPPVNDREAISMFVGTLKDPYRSHLVGSTPHNFMDIVSAGARVEADVKAGRIKTGTTDNGPSKKWVKGKKEEETQMIQGPMRSLRQRSRSQQPRGNFYMEPVVNQTLHMGPRPQFVAPALVPTQPNIPTRPSQQTHTRNTPKSFRRLEPIPMSYADLFPQLLEQRMISTIPGIPLTNPPPHWYNPEVRCAYHANSPGHPIDQCWAFKHKVQDLKDAGWLSFDAKPVGIQENPLPDHGKDNVGMIEEQDGEKFERRWEQMTLDWVYSELTTAGLAGLKAICPKGAPCTCQNTMKRSVQQCETFRIFLSSLIDSKRVEVSRVQKTNEVSVIGESDHPQFTNRPFIPIMGKTPRVPEAPVRVVISAPRPFAYHSDQAVPWRYNCEVRTEGETSSAAEARGITRSGRVYTPKVLEKVQPSQEQNRNLKKPVQSQEAEEFLKIIKHSEYNIIDQLKKMPAHISVLSLLLSSEAHREALLKALNQAYIPQDISIDNFNHVIGGLTATNYITFADEEIPVEGQGHNQALHVSAKCRDHMIARVLIDNGSSLNVMPMTTLQKLPVDPSYIRQNNLTVRAFDGTRRESVGSIEIPVQIGPVTFDITFQVMAITPSYSCLLGRPWIHNTGAVPSSLHQRVKFVVDGKLVCVYGETDVMITKPTSTPYVEVTEEALEDSFRAFEIINVTTIVEGSRIPHPQIPAAVHMMASEMIRQGYHPEKGLGKYLQGIRKPLMLKEVKDRYGLGYIPTVADRRKKAEEKKMRRVERITGETSSKEGLYVPSISQTFVKSSQSNLEAELRQLSISVLDAEVPSNTSTEWIHHLQPGVQLQNWSSFDLPDIIM
ncbi:uncharacterized protein LOC131158698 [Malania oleifera]|uniref:uncharacterized protein LOC131158698 n=1 Tax=Malania oleifera TaxID=397392 RepID=UPI0025AE590D|nr:uncharacterized protein LOC131158698 [Malania oleifera]